jgi:hypothetical protein
MQEIFRRVHYYDIHGHDRHIKEYLKVHWFVHNQPTFGSKFSLAGLHHAALSKHVASQPGCKGKSDAHKTATGIMAHVIRDPTLVTHHGGGLASFTQKAYDIMNDVKTTNGGAGAGGTIAGNQGGAATRKPTIPLFQQVASRASTTQKQPVINNSTANAPVVGKPLDEIATAAAAQQPEKVKGGNGGASEGKKRKNPGSSASAIGSQAKDAADDTPANAAPSKESSSTTTTSTTTLRDSSARKVDVSMKL